jgi:nitrite reductase/ring-hydroxylating ferredoxin subunit
VRFQPLEKLINLHDGYRCRFTIDGLQLLLIQQAGNHYLVEAQCPHRGQLLDSARIDANCVICPLHHYRFDLRSGQLLSHGEEPCRALRVYEPAYEGNEIGVVLD